MTAENAGTRSEVDEREDTGVDEGEAKAAFAEGYEDLLGRLGRFNLVIVGDTGAGKSSLVNAIFGKTEAATGIGSPVTRGKDYYQNETGTLGVWDFEGFEHGAKQSPVGSLVEKIREISKVESERKIHLAWFCWDAPTGRHTEGHRKIIEALKREKIPVLGVVTKVRSRNGQLHPDSSEFVNYLESQPLDLTSKTIFPTAAIDDAWGDEQYGLEQLLDASIELAPDAVEDAIRAAQRVSLKLKAALSRKWIGAAATSASAAAVTPIPVASAVVIAPIQLAMMGKISLIYGQSMKSMLGGGSSKVFQLGVSLTGRAAAQSLVKVLPFAGSAINATVAGLWTLAAGEVWRQMCERLFRASDPEDVRHTFDTFMPLVVELVKEWAKQGPSWAKD